jgi:dihydrofolate reductase
MNALPKLVVSSTLHTASWGGATPIPIVSLADRVTDLKGESGRDLLVLGSPRLTATLAQLDLLDELRVMLNPVALGRGKSLFNSMERRLSLRLDGMRRFASGNLLLTHQPRPAGSLATAR